MNKSWKILNLINYLDFKFASHFKVKDFWEADLETIGFLNLDDSKMIYVSTLKSDKTFLFL
ncbi:hypothetical protein HNQ88_003445 [Aureibacter tunicatorum]|uniref:Uncharacterized protein n=1 Tax=Aureibacter tunicatorum TaxID=866807 RepID=A0AAE3XS01_9BACT|nr:hypothetical protein [Aureibacter tunicatorum]BDD05740.1 hypothetical protein AUTU_32230 [Aureibacter tunicatorum]